MVSLDKNPTMEDLMRRAPLQSLRDAAADYAIFGNVEFTHPNGSVMTRKQWHRAMNREQELFDRLTLQMANDERAQRKKLPLTLRRAERAAWLRQERRINAKNSNNKT